MSIVPLGAIPAAREPEFPEMEGGLRLRVITLLNGRHAGRRIRLENLEKGDKFRVMDDTDKPASVFCCEAMSDPYMVDYDATHRTWVVEMVVLDPVTLEHTKAVAI